MTRRWSFAWSWFAAGVLVVVLPSCSGNIPLPDSDGDGIPDLIDPCPTNPDPTCVPEAPPAACYDCDAPPPASQMKFVKVRDPILGQYIVTLEKQAGKALSISEAVNFAQGFSGLANVQAFSPRIFSGFRARIADTTILNKLLKDKRVRRVQQDQRLYLPKPVKVSASAPWNLDRSDQRDLPLDGKYDPAQDGSNVAVYVLDTGCPSTDLKTCRQDHPDFGPRLQAESFSTIVFQGVFDANGHGTHTAGTATGTKFGICKSCKVISVRFLDANGSGSTSDAIRSLEWIVAHDPGPGYRKVNTNSWGGGPDPALNEAICNTIKAGVTVVVAAGNETADSCTASPAQVKQAITVAAADKSDTFAYFSNYGPGVDLIGGGVDVESDRPDGGTATMSGTSMATPEIAGAAALYLQRHPSATPAEVEAGLISEASEGKVSGLPAETANRLLYVTPVGTTPPPPGGTPPKASP